MKRFKYLLFALTFFIPNLVNADTALTGNVFDEESLINCLSSESTLDTCTLGVSIGISSTISITDGAEKMLDLNGYDIIGSDNLTELFYISNGSLVVTDSSIEKGSITSLKDVFYVHGNETVGESATNSELTIGKGVNILSGSSNAVYIRGNGAKLHVYGNLTSNGDYSVIQGNGTKNANTDAGNTEITIYEGASVINTYSYVDENTLVNPAIYHPQTGKLTIEGGTISGVTGVEMRSGTLVVNDGTIIGTAPKTVVKNNGNGPAIMGAGIGVAQHTTIQPVSITVNGGTIKGATALYEATPENPHDETIVSLNINGGSFITTLADGEAVYSENKTGFISGGTFNEDFASRGKEKYLKTGLSLVEDVNDNYAVNNPLRTSNPDTSDNVLRYVIFAILSLLAISLIIVFKKRNN